MKNRIIVIFFMFVAAYSSSFFVFFEKQTFTLNEGPVDVWVIKSNSSLGSSKFAVNFYYPLRRFFTEKDWLY